LQRIQRRAAAAAAILFPCEETRNVRRCYKFGWLIKSLRPSNRAIHIGLLLLGLISSLSSSLAGNIIIAAQEQKP